MKLLSMLQSTKDVLLGICRRTWENLGLEPVGGHVSVLNHTYYLIDSALVVPDMIQICTGATIGKVPSPWWRCVGRQVHRPWGAQGPKGLATALRTSV